MQPSGEIKGRIDRLRAIRKRLRWSEEFCAYQLGVTGDAIDPAAFRQSNSADIGPQTGGSQ